MTHLLKVINLKDEAQREVYRLIDKEYRKLPKRSDGEIDPAGEGLDDNDVDALRHVEFPERGPANFLNGYHLIS